MVWGWIPEVKGTRPTYIDELEPVRKELVREYESAISLNTDHNIYELGGETPKTVVSGESSVSLDGACTSGTSFAIVAVTIIAAPSPEDDMEGTWDQILTSVRPGRHRHSTR